jgi:Ca2+-binding RTX toxin-like protein
MSNNYENKINKDQCIKLLEEYGNYNHDDAEDIVDEIIYFGQHFAEIDDFLSKVKATRLAVYDFIIESKLLNFFLDENSTFKLLSDAHSTACSISNTFEMSAALIAIDKSNKEGLPPDADDLGEFLNGFLNIVNLMSGELTNVDAFTDSALEYFNNAVIMFRNKTKDYNFGKIYLDLPGDYLQEHSDINDGILNITSGLETAEGLSLEQLDDLINYVKTNKIYTNEHYNAPVDEIITYDEFINKMKEYAEDRYIYELNLAFEDAGVTAEQLQYRINNFNIILRTAEIDRSWNAFWKPLDGFFQTMNEHFDIIKGNIENLPGFLKGYYESLPGVGSDFNQKTSTNQGYTIYSVLDINAGKRYIPRYNLDGIIVFQQFVGDDPYYFDGKIYSLTLGEGNEFIEITDIWYENLSKISQYGIPEESDLQDFKQSIIQHLRDIQIIPLPYLHNQLQKNTIFMSPLQAENTQKIITEIKHYLKKSTNDQSDLKKFYDYIIYGDYSKTSWDTFNYISQNLGGDKIQQLINSYCQMSKRHNTDNEVDFNEYEMRKFVRISLLRPDIGYMLTRISQQGYDPLPNARADELLLSILNGTLSSDYPLLFDKNGMIVEEFQNAFAIAESDNILEGGSQQSETLKIVTKLIQIILSMDLDPTSTPDTAASGEGIESDNETLPETANNTNITKLQNLFEQTITQFIAQAEVALAQAQTVTSPLVLDLDNNGFETKAKTDGVYFDLDNNGFAEKTAWTSGDAFLTYDLNENGKIDNGGELFGNHTLVGNEKAADGFEALSQYDENGDGFIDENDSVYQLMRLWNDNGNGISEDGEFKTLAEMGVNSIDLNQTAPETINYTDATVSGVSNAEMADGTSRTVADFWFNVSTADTIQIYDGEFDEDILALPDVRSFGKMPSLRVAMQTDESGKLKELVGQYISAATIEEKRISLKQILYKLTGAESILPTSRGLLMDARDLHVLETMLGANYYGQGGNPGQDASAELNRILGNLEAMYSSFLSAETIKNYLSLIDFTEENGQISFDASLFNLYIELNIEQGNEVESILFDVAKYLKTVNKSGDNYKDFAEHYLNVSPGYVYCFLTDVSLLTGTTEKDNIYGTLQNDIIIGGTGNDTINGSSGNDTYVFNLGDGKDAYTDYYANQNLNKSDKIVFGEGISSETTYLTRKDNDLIIHVNGDTDDEITVSSYFGNTAYHIENIVFADGTTWSVDDISTLSAQIFGTDENNFFYTFSSGYGYSLDQTVYAKDGNDNVTGSVGNETFIGGKGDDIISGNGGNDTYVFNLGDGKDTYTDYYANQDLNKSDKIIFGEGISSETTYLTRKDNDLIIHVNGDTDDEITVSSYFGNTAYHIENIVFADGTTWSVDDISTLSAQIFGTDENNFFYTFSSGYGYSLDQTVYAKDGNDNVTGSVGNETFVGGKGDDIISGNGGNDTYVFNLGDGKDTYTDYYANQDLNKSDKIIFGEGINTDDLIFSKEGNNLKIEIAGTDDNITIYNHFGSNYYKIENFQTDDGSLLSYTNIDYLIQAMAEFTADTGMTASEAAQENNQAYSDIVNQMWVSQTVA